MSERRRRYPENSVVASIDQIQAMLAEERRPVRPAHPAAAARSTAPPDAPPPPDEAEQARPMAMPVGATGELGASSWEEVQNSRAARWANESQSAVMVPAIPRWRLWRRRLLLGAAAAMLVGATVGVMWLLRPQVSSVNPFEVPYLKALHAAEIAGIKAASAQQSAALSAQINTLADDKQALQAQLDSAKSQAAQAAVVADSIADAKPKTPSKRRKRVRRRSNRAGQKTRSKRRAPRRTSKTDKSLEGLLNTL